MLYNKICNKQNAFCNKGLDIYYDMKTRRGAFAHSLFDCTVSDPTTCMHIYLILIISISYKYIQDIK